MLRLLPTLAALVLLTGCSTLKGIQYPVSNYLGPPAATEAAQAGPDASGTGETAATAASEGRAGNTAAPAGAAAWRPLFRGIDISRYTSWDPPLHVWAVRVDLTAPGIQPVVTPSNGAGPLDTYGETTAQFLAASGVAVAVNASPFTPVNAIDGSPRDILGISASDGDLYSPPEGNGGALVFDVHGRARIVAQAAIAPSPAPTGRSAIRDAVGGFSIILRAGRNIGSQRHRAPRTAAGVSRDGRYLYLLTVDGRQLAWSMGVTTRELAAWLRYFGAWNGLNLDGGGSTTLVVRGSNGDPLVVNSPIDGLVPGKMRIVGNNLGFRALPLDAASPARRN